MTFPRLDCVIYDEDGPFGQIEIATTQHYSHSNWSTPTRDVPGLKFNFPLCLMDYLNMKQSQLALINLLSSELHDLI